MWFYCNNYDLVKMSLFYTFVTTHNTLVDLHGVKNHKKLGLLYSFLASFCCCCDCSVSKIYATWILLVFLKSQQPALCKQNVLLYLYFIVLKYVFVKIKLIWAKRLFVGNRFIRKYYMSKKTIIYIYIMFKLSIT